MGEEELVSQSMLVLGEWLRYKRYSDNVKLEARLVECLGKKLMEIKAPTGGEDRCPGCQYLLSVRLDSQSFMWTYLEPADFHAKHRPIT